jgi:probable F420-dependent oxidoreductase
VSSRPFRFGVTAHLAGTRDDWRSLCRGAEDAGCTNLVVSDHFGNQFALIPALGAAIDASTALRVGALVACNDYRHPVMYAKELATLDVLSGGRVDWGIGAGWVAAEYEKVGIGFDRGSVRVDRLCEAVAVMKGLFADGAFSFAGHHYSVHELDGRPKPIQRPHPPLLIGGAGRRMLSFAAREADIVGIGPSLSSRRLGHLPPRQSVEAAVDEQLGWIRIAATQRVGDLELQMVASPIVVTADPPTTARRIADRAGLTPDELLRSPHVWVGSIAEICDKLERHRDRWGVSYWTVPASALPAVTPVIARLAGT